MHNHSPRTSSFLLAVLVIGSVAAIAPAWGQVHEDLKLYPRGGAADDNFGVSIAIDNGIVAVGAYEDDDNGSGSGSLYLFNASTGVRLSKLIPSDGAADDNFGISIAINNGVVAVGSLGDDDNGSSSGSAYLFDANTGFQITKLLPSDGAVDDWFGIAIAIDNGVVAVGAYGDDDNGSLSGSVYLFDASTGAQIAKLLPGGGMMGDWFGVAIAIDNGVVVVGAVGDNNNGIQSGAAYLFDASTGAQIAKLLPGDGEAHDWFGGAIAIDNGIVAVGAHGDNAHASNSGSAYLFDAISGAQIAKLLPSEGEAYDRFGYSIGIDNGVVAVGTRLDDDNGTNSGSAYLFDALTGAQLAKLLPSDGVGGDEFGVSTAIDNGIVAVGAGWANADGNNSGTAYLFKAINCSADFNEDGQVNTLDFLAYLNAFDTGCP